LVLIEANENPDRMNAFSNRVPDKTGEICRRGAIVEHRERVVPGPNPLVPEHRMSAVKIGLTMGAKQWQKLKRITRLLPLRTDELGVTTTDEVPVDRGHRISSSEAVSFQAA
jgi:hypothetical protein